MSRKIEVRGFKRIISGANRWSMWALYKCLDTGEQFWFYLGSASHDPS